MKKNYLTIFLITIMTCQIFYAQNETPKNSILTDRFLISAGVFLPTKNISVDASGEIPTDGADDIDFDEVFGFGNIQTTFYLNFMWRFSKSKKWSLQSEYFNISNKADVVLQNDVEWNDYIFKAGSNATGGVNLALYKVFFGRVISTGQKHELGGGLGVHLLNVGGYIEGDAYVNDDNYSLQRSEVSVVAPLPNIGFWYIYAPIEKLSFQAKLDWFAITIGDFGGGLWNVTPGVNYQFLKNLGINASYKFYKINADVNKDTWNGGFDMSFSGPAFSIIGSF